MVVLVCSSERVHGRAAARKQAEGQRAAASMQACKHHDGAARPPPSQPGHRHVSLALKSEVKWWWMGGRTPAWVRVVWGVWAGPADAIYALKVKLHARACTLALGTYTGARER